MPNACGHRKPALAIRVGLGLVLDLDPEEERKLAELIFSVLRFRHFLRIVCAGFLHRCNELSIEIQ